MRDEDESVSIAVNGKRVRSSECRGAVSGVMSVMRDARALGKLGGCSEETSRGGARRGVCERACRASETRRVRTMVRRRVGDGSGRSTGRREGIGGGPLSVSVTEIGTTTCKYTRGDLLTGCSGSTVRTGLLSFLRACTSASLSAGTVNSVFLFSKILTYATCHKPACDMRLRTQPHLSRASSGLRPLAGPPSGCMHSLCICPSSRGPHSALAHLWSTLHMTQRCISACADPETSLQLTPTFHRSTAPQYFLWLPTSRRQCNCCSPLYDSCTTCPDSCTTHRQYWTDSDSFPRALTRSSP
jgi:hypothetical protein